MNKYRMKPKLLIVTLCLIALLTLFVAASASAQTSATAPNNNPRAAGPPLFNVTHDATLQGDGTSGSPLGIKASPTLIGSLTVDGDIHADSFAAQQRIAADIGIRLEDGMYTEPKPTYP